MPKSYSILYTKVLKANEDRQFQTTSLILDPEDKPANQWELHSRDLQINTFFLPDVSDPFPIFHQCLLSQAKLRHWRTYNHNRTVTPKRNRKLLSSNRLSNLPRLRTCSREIMLTVHNISTIQSRHVSAGVDTALGIFTMQLSVTA